MFVSVCVCVCGVLRFMLSVIVKAAVFVLDGSQRLRVCQDPSLSQKVGSQQVPRCKLIRSWTLRQQLGKYAVNTLPRRNWKLGIFTRCLCAEPGYTAIGDLLHSFKNHFFVCYRPGEPVNIRPFGFQNYVFWGPTPQVGALKTGGTV